MSNSYKLLVFSHKICWKSESSPSGWATDGGFALQMDALAGKFCEVRIITAVDSSKSRSGEMYFQSKNITVTGLNEWVNPSRSTLVKLVLPIWILRYLSVFIRQIVWCDYIHIPLPSHIGLSGFFLSLASRKKVFVRHCGNWLLPKTQTEKLIKWLLIKLAGKRVICWATGGDTTPPSEKNSNIEWIFSTSLKSAQFNSQTEPKKIGQGRLHLVHIGRQEWEKGAHILIEAMPEVLSKFPEATLSVVGAGSALPALVKLSESNGLQNKIIFTGKLNQAGVLNILDNSSVFCFPSYSSEGFPKVVLEAMSRGVPVITSKVSILKKLIPESGAGELMIDCTKKSFLEALYKLTSTSGHYENCSINALSYSGQFTLEKWADLIITKIEYTWKVKIH